MPRKVGLYMKDDWKAPIMFYQFKCPTHGNVVNYPHGSGRLECPVCLWEARKAEKGKAEPSEEQTTE